LQHSFEDRVRFVLVEPSHAGNIGAAARAIKTMGFGRLSLVKPCRFNTYECYARASGANDVLDGATTHEDLQSAIAECSTVFGTSARERTLSWPVESLRQTAERCVALPTSQQIGIVFGRERSGLTNEELALCSAQLTIPSSDTFSSLNLAAAVQVVAYELRCASAHGDVRVDAADVRDEPAPQQDLERFHEHLQAVMTKTGFFDPSEPRLLLPRVRRLFARAEPRVSELQLLRGFLSSIERVVSPGTRDK
jgi:TrmH family RNA methyltransferase